MTDRSDPPPTAKELRRAARMAQQVDDLLERCNRHRILDLMGFDLPFLADQFENAANRLEGKPIGATGDD